MLATRPIIALDFPDRATILNFLGTFPKEEKLFLKVGMELFYQEGPSIITWLKELGHDIFLDLKLHDIPNTVERAMTGIASLGVTMTNVHASGGQKMMKAALRGLEKGTKSTEQVPLLLAVTQLTSSTEEMIQKEQLVSKSLLTSVSHYATLAYTSGLAGVVCSALEAEQIKKDLGNETFICVTPGIRPKGSQLGDQKRVVTPCVAKQLGATYIVVGRPITSSESPYDAYLTIKNDWNGEKIYD